MAAMPPSSATAVDEAGSSFLDRVVEAARGYLGAEVGFLSEFEAGEKVIRHVAGRAGKAGLSVGTRFPLSSTYCYRVACGQLPEVIYDTRVEGRVASLPITEQLGIRSYIGVPVRTAGRAVGTLCCINFQEHRSEESRDLAFMRFLAQLVGFQLERDGQAGRKQQESIECIQRVLAQGGPRIEFQPIVELASGETVGVEALARFDDLPYRSPDLWFREAWAAGLGVELEVAAIRTAVAALPRLPGNAYLSLNVSPATLVNGEVFAVLEGPYADRLVVELTEHAAVDEYTPLLAAIQRLKTGGIRVSIDDLGAGYASLRHVLEVSPDVVKLDMSLTRGIDSDRVKQALARAVVGFAESARLAIVAEGIETVEEAQTVRELGVSYGQGYYFARPRPLPL